MNYKNLLPGEIIKTRGTGDKEGKNDQLFSTWGQWLDAPSAWNGETVPENVKFRRPV